MKKLAIFVEGQTEQIFVEKLLYYITSNLDISIEKRRGFGGKTNNRVFITLSCPDTKHPYYILLVDSSNDGRVVTDIRDNYRRLIEQGYSKIIGLRDVYPHNYKDFKKLRRVTTRFLPKNPVMPNICFAVMEVETWFIAEYNHFKKLHPRLTRQFIKNETGIDPGDPEIELHKTHTHSSFHTSPAQDLNRIYKLVKRSYTKKRQQVNSIVNVLDFKALCHEVPKRVHSLGFFLRQLEDFFKSVNRPNDNN